MAKNQKQESVFDVTGIIPQKKPTVQPVQSVQQSVQQSVNEIKDARLNLKIKQSVKDKLYRLAESKGISATDFIEEMVNAVYRERNT